MLLLCINIIMQVYYTIKGCKPTAFNPIYYYNIV